MNPQFPLYIPSKGRAFDDNRMTFRHLEAMGVPYHIIVEEQEVDAYRKVIRGGEILVLDKAYQRDYDTFSNLGESLGKGSGPARNFAWDHSVASGAPWHWVMDDNINGFFRLHKNLKTPVADGTIFRCMEDFCLRYENIAMAGPNYFMFAPRKTQQPPFVTNTRIYSCNLIRNDVPFRWRGRYNEDTDLSLRMLKAGWSTVLFNAFLQYKLQTQTLKGGNTDTIYKGEKVAGEKYARNGTTAKSQMLADMHPDVAQVVWKFQRWHHEVNYSIFKVNRLRKRPDVEIPGGRNNYGMSLYEFETADEAADWTIRRTAARTSPAMGTEIEPEDVIDFDALTGRKEKGLILI